MTYKPVRCVAFFCHAAVSAAKGRDFCQVTHSVEVEASNVVAPMQNYARGGATARHRIMRENVNAKNITCTYRFEAGTIRFYAYWCKMTCSVLLFFLFIRKGRAAASFLRTYTEGQATKLRRWLL